MANKVGGNELEVSAVHAAQLNTPRQCYYPQSSAEDYLAPDLVSKIVTNHRKSVSEICMNSLVLDILRDKLHANARVLHVGCRTGYLLACIMRIMGANNEESNARIIGLTKEPKLINNIRQKLFNDNSSFLKSPVISVMDGDFNLGCPQYAPYDVIFVTASASHRPNTLISQLKPGGRLLLLMMPLGEEPYFLKFDKHENGSVKSKRLMKFSNLPEAHVKALATQLGTDF